MIWLRYLFGRVRAAWRANRRAVLLPVLAVLAVLVAGGGGVAWFGVAHDQDVRYARARDAVVEAGSSAASTLNTLDYRSAERDLDAWRKVATGGLAKQLDSTHDSDVKAVGRAKAHSEATVDEAAVSEIDLHAGTASVVVELRVKLRRNGTSSDHDSHLSLQMKRTQQGWKASAMNVLGSAG